MNKRIYFGKNPPLSFRENLEFDYNCPYKIRCKDFANDDIAPLHYAQTMEIEVCCGITGEMVIENTRISINGNAVVVVPPGAVHSVLIRRGPGRVYLLHISFEELRPILNVEALLEQSGRTFTGMQYLCPDFERIHGLLLEMIEKDSQPFARIRGLLSILEILSEQMPEAADEKRLETGNSELRRIIRWTEQNFTGPIQLKDAANAAGFTKNYFCAWFKENTGLTYNRYLNLLRISNACRLLAQSGSIAAACYDSGFSDMSYFIQLFKKMQGCTPKNYLKNLKKQETDEEDGAANGSAETFD